MVEGPDAEENGAVARAVTEGLTGRPSVKRAADHADLSRPLDPMLAWRYADPDGRRRIAAALTPAGMRSRLRETRALLLTPGSGALAELVAQDPLRLSQLAFERPSLGGGMKTQADGAFASDDGRMRLVLVQAAGQSLRGADAKAFVADVNAVIDPLARAHPAVTLGLAEADAHRRRHRDHAHPGPGAFEDPGDSAAAGQRGLRADLPAHASAPGGDAAARARQRCGRRGLARPRSPARLSAIAVAFTSVVARSVGVDTGVHGLRSPARRPPPPPPPPPPPRRARASARAEGPRVEARRRTTRAVMMAAITAAAAFGALGLSQINAVRQLGLLCGAGEFLTAVAIVAFTPEIGAFLERGTPPAEAPSRWTVAIEWLTRTRARAAFMAALAIAPIPALVHHRAPAPRRRHHRRPPPVAPAPGQPAEALRRLRRPARPARGAGRRPRPRRERRARERADAPRRPFRRGPRQRRGRRVPSPSLVPATRTQEGRYAERDALDLPARADDLARALAETGFAPDRFTAALEGMRHPPHALSSLDDLANTPAAILVSRYLGRDGDHLVALYLQPTAAPGAEDRLLERLHAWDGAALLTGYRPPRRRPARLLSGPRILPTIGPSPPPSS